MMTRQDQEQRERETLAPYAILSGETRGRRVDEPKSMIRTDFQRDRGRIIHSAAFRRLEYKTQVFVNHEGDHYRTRLTHTMEAAQIGRTLARALCLNEDYVEAVVLAHDLGHTPFGHAGERVMNELMHEYGGFEHNLQSLRVVEFLETRYPRFEGLNLTYEVREGIAKHSTPYDLPANLAEYNPDEFALLEAQLADLSDEIAYNNHDVDDGLASGLLSWQEMEEVELFGECALHVKSLYPDHKMQDLKHVIVSRMIHLLVTDLVQTSAAMLEDNRIGSVDAVRASSERMIRFSDAMERKKNELKNYLMANMYSHWRVVRMEEKAKRILKDLFFAFMERETQVPESFRRRYQEGTPKALFICDYLAGMTDRYALDEHRRLFDPHTRV